VFELAVSVHEMIAPDGLARFTDVIAPLEKVTLYRYVLVVSDAKNAAVLVAQPFHKLRPLVALRLMSDPAVVAPVLGVTVHCEMLAPEVMYAPV